MHVRNRCVKRWDIWLSVFISFQGVRNPTCSEGFCVLVRKHWQTTLWFRDDEFLLKKKAILWKWMNWWWSPSIRKKKTNYFIVSLAFADLLVAVVVMPFAAIELTTGEWRYGEIFCLVRTSLDVLLTTASILHLCCIALDRSVCEGRRESKKNNLSKAKNQLSLCVTAGIMLSAASHWSIDTRWPLWEWLWCSAAAGSSPHSSLSYPSCKAGTLLGSRTLWVLSSLDQSPSRGRKVTKSQVHIR